MLGLTNWWVPSTQAIGASDARLSLTFWATSSCRPTMEDNQLCLPGNQTLSLQLHRYN